MAELFWIYAILSNRNIVLRFVILKSFVKFMIFEKTQIQPA